MSLFGSRTPEPPATPADTQLAALTARVDQAVKHVDTALGLRRRLSTNEHVDVLLEIRQTLTRARQEVDI